MKTEQILEALRQSIIEMEPEMAERAAHQAIDAGLDPVLAIDSGLVPGINRISEQFDTGEAFVPQMLLAAEAFEAATAILTAELVSRDRKHPSEGKVLIYTAQGDIHDIGKNIVKTFLKAGGFEVFDLGRDVPAPQVLEKALALDVDIIAGSALMTTTMSSFRELVELLETNGLRRRFLLIFGGAPVTGRWVREIGGDGYSKHASEAVTLAKSLLENRRHS